MTYQALARKWRPGRFADVVGQNHVVSALTNALDNDRVHHAFLFTGTRGVGKTTLARLLAKSLNCEQGVGSTPCGECSACGSVEQGRFVDLLEIDAASRTRVDDTRELLDNVQYAPTMGRYKVYLIDEVHMLSTHSFNALLKTLEEPPPHVKFLLATTDPQKLPATILSRCLQFNLRALAPNEIAAQLTRILGAEAVEYESEAVELLARAADGSMRDALSLLDQAIAFSGTSLVADSVRDMLGMIEASRIPELLRALQGGDAAAVFALVALMRERNIDFSRTLDELLILLHEVALLQQAPELAAERDMPWQGLEEFVDLLSPERVQLFYQIALTGKRDLPLAPDPARGFEMLMLRILAFDPVDAPDGDGVAEPPARKTAAPARGGESRRPPPVRPRIVRSQEVRDQAPGEQASAEQASPQPERIAPPTGPTGSRPSESAGGASIDAASWAMFCEGGGFSGLVRELAMNLELTAVEGDTLRLRLHAPLSHLHSDQRLQTLSEKARDWFQRELKLVLETHRDEQADTPAVRREQRLRAEYQEAMDGMREDPRVASLIDQFDAEIVPESVRPAKHRGN